MSALSHGQHFFKAAGVRFNYLVRGTGPLAIVQSVGWGLPGAYLGNGIGPYLEDKRTVVYFEPRGNGDSSKPDDSSTMTTKTMAEDIEHLKSHLGLKTLPLLVGHSHGGAIALRYAQRYPDRVSKLLLISPQVMDSPRGHVKAWMEKRKDDPAYAPAAAKLIEVARAGGPKSDEQFQEALDTMLLWWFTDVKKAEILRKHLAGSRNLPTASAWQTNRNDMSEENSIPHIKDAGLVKAETLVIQGAEDAACSPEGALAITNGIKGSKLKIFPSVGHFPWIEDPEGFRKEVDNFITS
ncbi:proline iminopeptidase [Colletotrichum truncatum]|uniref:Proline iminopeptidase n=1 Tax=Colletotrichum truncatum TaxID=5467 RepID=A0ACC3Z1K1_COLTU|nr:proline iminopeptidase [Colletotrichum truncatum]KAF6788872.1 proline iminopeptidase [Colletotrichum truncatum]